MEKKDGYIDYIMPRIYWTPGALCRRKPTLSGLDSILSITHSGRRPVTGSRMLPAGQLEDMELKPDNHGFAGMK
ncbi:MAG: hypothetical protein Q4D81_13105 [Eubacteriales bacterium]|nr:hypothetical protein [Eubacteriales bacterium]